MKTKQNEAKPGLWFVDEGGDGWPHTVARWNPDGNYQYESLTDEHGELLEFVTYREARNAALKANLP